MTARSWPILAPSGVLLVVILALHSRPVPVRWAGAPLTEPATLDAAHSPCPAERLALACDRWADAGWPRCTVAHGYGVAVVAYDGPHAGAAVLGGPVGVAPDRCAEWDAALEHEIGHALHGLAHAGGVGSVMHPSRPGLRMPEWRPYAE